ncbi:myomegalin isoform X1 [Spea bombifrons]|uniref:myomegalin isoform X1 n=1 Tax=Spea bombifrons TaxID=233779 RepID=UPI00234A7ECF|nr:myomegalin isoform X1 [Spea bombifrons]
MDGDPVFMPYLERIYPGKENDLQQQSSHMAALLLNTKEKGPPSQAHTLREFEKHLNDLKKENFSLKLRIYFLEERIQQKYEENSDNVYKRNIELKVEVESLKQELQEKQQLLDKACSAAENPTSYNEVELRQQFEQKQVETEHVQELLKNKIQVLLEEARLSKNEADRLSALVEAEKENCMELKKTIKEYSMEMTEARLLQKNYCATLTEKDKMIQQLALVLDSKDSLINQQKEENKNLVTSLEQTIHDLKFSLQNKECELKMLQENLHQVSSELNIAQELSHKQSIIHTLKETLQDRDNEVAELYHRVDDLNGTIAKLEEMLHRKQAENLQASTVTSSQLQLLDLQNTLFCTKSELQKLQQTLRQKEQQLNNAKRSQLLLEADLVEGQQQKETTWKHNQELHEALHKLQGELDEKTLQLKNIEEEKCTKLQAQEHNIQHLNQTLSQNKQLIQEYMDLLEYQQSLYKCAGDNEHLVEKLHQRIKDRDAALQYAIDDKFCALEEKEKEMQQLKTFGRDKERDLEQLQSIVSANEETIISLDNLVKAKDMELEQIAAACRNLQWLLQKTEEINRHFLNEKDSIVQQLQSALEERSKEMEGMTACFLRSPALRSGELIEELKVCMEMKEKLLQSSLHSLSQQADEHKREIQELLDTIASEKMDQAIICRNCKLKEQQNLEGNLPHQLVQSGVLCGDLTSMCIRHESGDLKEAAEENEKAVTAEKNVLAKAKEDLQFFLRKEKEYQHELSALRCVIMKQSEQLQEQSADMDALTRSVQIKEDLIKDLQVQLVDPEEMPTVERLTQEVLVLKEKLASMEMDSQKCSGQCVQELLEGFDEDRSRLKQALETEKQLHSNLIQFHQVPRSSELEAELQTAHALRTQLEDTLEKAVERLARLDSKNRVSAISYGGLMEDMREEDFSFHPSDSFGNETNAPSNLSCTGNENKREFSQEAKDKSTTQEELFILKIEPEHAEVHSAVDIRTFLDDSCLINEKLKNESAILGQREDEKMEDDIWSVEEDLKQEIIRLQGKMAKAETVIKHLKAQLELNYRNREEGFNPDLIVNMVKEIEHLQMKKTSAKSTFSVLVQMTGNETSNMHCSKELSLDAGDITNPITYMAPQSVLLVSKTCLCIQSLAS